MLEMPSQTLRQSFRGSPQKGGLTDENMEDEPQVSVYQACYALAQAQVEKLAEDVYKSKKQHPETIQIAEDDAVIFRQNLQHREFMDKHPEYLQMVRDMTSRLSVNSAVAALALIQTDFQNVAAAMDFIYELSEDSQGL